MDAQTAQLVQALQRPQAYPHEVQDVTLRETHISWIFLTGEFAYKVKKPVATAFLDFTTLKRRRFYCDEELRLNRRFAAELYLEVVPVTGTLEDPHVQGSGPAIEYAVRMRQFPQAALLSEMIAAGSLTAGRVDELAGVVARFHADAARLAPDRQLATPEVIRRSALENFDAIGDGPEPAAARELDALRDWTDAEWLRLRSRFAERRASGSVRECHGDLHLGNIVLWDGAGETAASQPRVLMFDCIEFNERFRWIDVLSDAAFTMMDLSDRGRDDFAHRFRSAYLEHSGDYEGLDVLPWYLVYRALVRAKVAALRARQDDAAADERDRCLEESAEYIRIASRYTSGSRPQLVITHGVSGSGKTTGTQPLIHALGAIRVRSDVERKRLAGPAADQASGSGVGKGIYDADWTRRTYERLADCASRILSAGFTAVVDATFLRRDDRIQFRRLAERLRAPFHIVPFEADETTLIERITARREQFDDASEATVDVLRHQLQTREPLQAGEAECVCSIEHLLSA